MTPAERIIRKEIFSHGPIPFRRFMNIALYNAEFGYYRQSRDHFGTAGDFYTAEQLQPVFGILISRAISELFDQMRRPAGFTVVELGAGRGEMAEALSEFTYVPLDIERGVMPHPFEGVVFANEFFDALPVDVYIRTGGEFRERLVGISANRLAWVDGRPATGMALAYLQKLVETIQDGQLLEVSLAAMEWMARIGAALVDGYVFLVDYGYTSAELPRHFAGTLMSYHRHVADEDVLAAPGEHDITAHVAFTALEDAAAAFGFERVRFETLASTLLRAGQAGHLESIFEGAGQAEQMKRRLQLKTLLFGMGETFRTLLLKKCTK